MRRAPIIALLAGFALAAPAAPAAAAPVRATQAWATVNVCDTTAQPNQMGIRGSMPGLPRRTRMYMRFRVQYQDLEGRWRTVRSGADSGWVKVASGRRGVHDAGWTFEFEPPAAGGAHVLRGVVGFQWRRRADVLRRDRRVTQAGHPGTAGADPSEFSAATCAIA
jgi:hypothetical protein